MEHSKVALFECSQLKAKLSTRGCLWNQARAKQLSREQRNYHRLGVCIACPMGEAIKESVPTEESQMEKTKICKECGREKDLERDFQRNAKAKDGHLNTCKGCMIKKLSHGHKNRKAKKEKERKAPDRLTLDFGLYPEVYDKLAAAAFAEIRTVEEQAIYWLLRAAAGSV